MASGPSGPLLDAALPFRDIVIPVKPTLEATRAAAGPAADLAPAGGVDVMVVVLIAATIAAVLALIVRARRRK